MRMLGVFMNGFKWGAGIAAAAGFFLLALTSFATAAVTPDQSSATNSTRAPRIHLAQMQTQAPPPPPQGTQPTDAPQSIGTVATLQGSATVTRGNVPAALKLNDDIFSGDTVRTGSNGAIGITLDDETTFNMGANAVMVMDNYLYESGGAKNAGLFNVARGTVAFVAGQVAHTGDMRISTPTATLGVRGTTGVIEVPDNARTPGDVAIKLYNDADGRVGRIEVFGAGPNGARIGVLDRPASGFSIRPGAGGRFSAFALQISPQQAARDRGFVGQLFRAHDRGRQLVIQRRNFRQQNFQRGPGQQRGQFQRGPQQRGQFGPPGARPQNGPRPAPGLQRQNFRNGPGMRPSPGQPQRGVRPPPRRGERDRFGR